MINKKIMLKGYEKLKERMELIPHIVVEQKHFLSCPIYLFDLNSKIDPNYITEICKKYQTLEFKEKETQSVYAWRSDYLHRGNKAIPELEPLFQLVEGKTTKIIKDGYKSVVDHYWFAIYNQGDSSKIHNHYGCELACVYYASYPENSAPLVITHLDSEISITPKPGNLLVFPAICNHRVPVSENTKERIIVAMNTLKYSSF